MPIIHGANLSTRRMALFSAAAAASASVSRRLANYHRSTCSAFSSDCNPGRRPSRNARPPACLRVLASPERLAMPRLEPSRQIARPLPGTRLPSESAAMAKVGDGNAKFARKRPKSDDAARYFLLAVPPIPLVVAPDLTTVPPGGHLSATLSRCSAPKRAFSTLSTRRVGAEWHSNRSRRAKIAG